MRLRQVALAAKDLEATTERLGRLLGINYGYHDPGIIKFGLDNWVAAVGDTFLEVVSPVQEDTTAGRFLERRGGDGGYMVILQTESLEAAKSRLENAGARIVWTADGKAETGETTVGLHVHPRDCGGAILSIDEATPTDAWVWAGPKWQEHDSSFLSQISGVEMQSSDPAGMASRWSELLDAQVTQGTSPDGRPASVIDLNQRPGGMSGEHSGDLGVMRFVQDDNGRGDGVSALDVDVTNKERFLAALTEFGIKPEQGAKDWCWADEAGIRVFFKGAA